MPKCLRLLVVSIALGISAWLPTLAKDTDVMRDGWTMEQNSQLMGDVSVICSAKGVKVTSHKRALSMLCVAPFTEVVLFSERTKQYHVSPLSTFRCPVTKTLSVVNCGLLEETPMIKKDDSTYQRLKVHCFESTAQFTQGQIKKYQAHELPGRSIRSVTACSTDDFKQDPHIGLVLALFFGLPKMPGVPVSLDFVDLGADKNHSLATNKITKAKIADSSFTLPSTYKKISKHENLFVSPDTADEMELMNLGGGH